MKVAIVMGSASDNKIAMDAKEVLDNFDIETELRVISAHRTPKIAFEYAEKLEENGFDLVIAIAGKAAHLAGVLASLTILPVIGVPAKSSTLDGLDSLLSTVQMPKGVPVATVAIDGGYNAAILAAEILSIGNIALREKLRAHKEKIESETIKSDEEIREN
ncbi:MAG TPA: 5-(carboxyamino)imidazole ribonucleotide mutase [Soehngenia sp.]|nr:5-(carboxyamino)imidazole ribonucleotide mutase [Soehngenia sp.]HPP31899.1 5-(carboxyamino)imidazole ribonucleotide mutase [Soehngenia sp.]